MSITYFCNDKNGNVYTRYSEGHTQPIYKTATISRLVGHRAAKHGVSYSSKQQLLGRHESFLHDYRTGQEVKRPTWVEVVEVRAYEGRHKVEPDYLSQAQIDEMLSDLADEPSPAQVEHAIEVIGEKVAMGREELDAVQFLFDGRPEDECPIRGQLRQRQAMDRAKLLEEQAREREALEVSLTCWGVDFWGWWKLANEHCAKLNIPELGFGHAHDGWMARLSPVECARSYD